MIILSILTAVTDSLLKTTLKSCVTPLCNHISGEQVGMVKQVGEGERVGVDDIAWLHAPSGFRPRQKPSRSELKQWRYPPFHFTVCTLCLAAVDDSGRLHRAHQTSPDRNLPDTTLPNINNPQPPSAFHPCWKSSWLKHKQRRCQSLPFIQPNFLRRTPLRPTDCSSFSDVQYQKNITQSPGPVGGVLTILCISPQSLHKHPAFYHVSKEYQVTSLSQYCLKRNLSPPLP